MTKTVFAKGSSVKSRMTWLAYTKIILDRVSFDPEIFKKELRKALKHLSKKEILKPEKWCINHFSSPLSIIAVKAIQESFA